MKTARFTLLTLVLTLFCQFPGHAWEAKRCGANLRKWPTDTVWYSPMSNGFSGDWRTALERGRSGWNTGAPGGEYEIRFSYTNSTVIEFGDRTNHIGLTGSYNFGTNVLAVCITQYDPCIQPFSRGRIDETDILFDISENWNLAPNPNPANWWQVSLPLVALHELGHGMGLQHERDVLATMNPTYPFGGVLGYANSPDPHADDLMGSRAFYGNGSFGHDLAAHAYVRTGEGTSAPGNYTQNTLRGSWAQFQYTVLNRGHYTEGPVRVHYYLSRNRTITTSDTYLGWVNLGDLPAGFEGTYTGWAFIPSSTSPASYYLGVLVDPWRSHSDRDRSNNGVATVWPTNVR